MQPEKRKSLYDIMGAILQTKFRSNKYVHRSTVLPVSFDDEEGIQDEGKDDDELQDIQLDDDDEDNEINVDYSDVHKFSADINDFIMSHNFIVS